jgi:hypothetical protein
MPVTNCDAEMVFHPLPEHHTIRLVHLESQIVIRPKPFEPDPIGHAAKELFRHCNSSERPAIPGSFVWQRYHAAQAIVVLHNKLVLNVATNGLICQAGSRCRLAVGIKTLRGYLVGYRPPDP